MTNLTYDKQSTALLVITGGVPVPLWNDPAQSSQRGPSWSPDGTWIAYYGIRDGKPAVMKVRIGANVPAEFIATMATYQPARWSPVAIGSHSETDRP